MTSTATVPQLKAATGATFLVFGINGLVFASWAARIPAVTEILHITAGQMGTLLLCLAVGSLIALPTAGFVVGRIGTANTVRSAGLVAAAAGVGVALSLMAASIPGTAIALFFFGITMIVRRVVTGHDKIGKSVFLSDGPTPRAKEFKHTPGFKSSDSEAT